MAMRFEELDETTRQWMLKEFDAEQSGGCPYVSATLSAAGRAAFPSLMRQAIAEGTEQTLITALSRSNYWNRSEAVRKGEMRSRSVNHIYAAERLGLTEFNTWYVRGLAARLLDEGIERCQVYTAGKAKSSDAKCELHEGDIYSVRHVYAGHRIRYWPKLGDKTKLSIPAGPNCHHTIRRLP